VPRVMFGQPFYFMQSRVLEIPTGVKVRTLAEFRDALAEVDAAVVYLHVVESRGRKGRRRNDFAAWIDEQLGLPELATAVARTTSSSSSAPSRARAPRRSTPPPTWSSPTTRSPPGSSRRARRRARGRGAATSTSRVRSAGRGPSSASTL